MRTTLNIEDGLLKRARETAARTGRTLGKVIEDALRESFARQSTKRRRGVRLTTVDGNGPRPGVDLDDSAGLLDLMERDG